MMMYYRTVTASKLKRIVLEIENRGNRNNYLNVANEWMITHAIHELIIALIRVGH